MLCAMFGDSFHRSGLSASWQETSSYRCDGPLVRVDLFGEGLFQTRPAPNESFNDWISQP